MSCWRRRGEYQTLQALCLCYIYSSSLCADLSDILSSFSPCFFPLFLIHLFRSLPPFHLLLPCLLSSQLLPCFLFPSLPVSSLHFILAFSFCFLLFPSQFYFVYDLLFPCLPCSHPLALVFHLLLPFSDPFMASGPGFLSFPLLSCHASSHLLTYYSCPGCSAFLFLFSYLVCFFAFLCSSVSFFLYHVPVFWNFLFTIV